MIILKLSTVWITTNYGKFLKEIGIPDHLTWLLQNLYAGLEATVRTRHGTMNWFQIGKGVHQGCIFSQPYLTSMQFNIMWNAGLNEAQAGIKTARSNNQYPQICRWHHHHGRKWRETEEPVDEGERKEWKIWLKTIIENLRPWYPVPSLHGK